MRCGTCMRPWQAVRSSYCICFTGLALHPGQRSALLLPVLQPGPCVRLYGRHATVHFGWHGCGSGAAPHLCNLGGLAGAGLSHQNDGLAGVYHVDEVCLGLPHRVACKGVGVGGPSGSAEVGPKRRRQQCASGTHGAQQLHMCAHPARGCKQLLHGPLMSRRSPQQCNCRARAQLETTLLRAHPVAWPGSGGSVRCRSDHYMG